MNTLSLCRHLSPLLLGALMLLATAIALPAQDTPTEGAAGCVKNAWDKNVQCQTDGKWWNDLACAIKFEADVILCVNPLIPR